MVTGVRWLRASVVLALPAGLVWVAGWEAGAQIATPAPTGFTAAMYTGSCAEAGGEPAYDLGPLISYSDLSDLSDINESRADTGLATLEPVPPRGSAAALPVLTLSAELDDTDFEDLLDGGTYALVVLGEAGAAVACGELGGVVYGDELAIGLAPVADSGYAGVALLDVDEETFDDDDVEVTVYIVQTAAGGGS